MFIKSNVKPTITDPDKMKPIAFLDNSGAKIPTAYTLSRFHGIVQATVACSCGND